MRSLRLPRRPKADTLYAAPMQHQENEQTVTAAQTHRSAIEDVLGDVPQAAESNDLRGSAAVFGVIGTWSTEETDLRVGSGSAQPERKVGLAGPAEDVIEALHAQYWRTLTDPHALMGDHWAGPTDDRSMRPDDTQADAGGRHDALDRLPASGSIEVLLSGECSLEECFGPLERGHMSDLNIEPVPEVLRPFAPSEYHAAATRRMPGLPPALTRREHHALSIDSPLPASLRQHEK
jgi:hypothetical protein